MDSQRNSLTGRLEHARGDGQRRVADRWEPRPDRGLAMARGPIPRSVRIEPHATWDHLLSVVYALLGISSERSIGYDIVKMSFFDRQH
jgi:hypothetical protein